jgi:hypothetical protein
MARCSRPPVRSPSAAGSTRIGHRPEDDLFNQQIADSMRDAAEAREALSQATSAQDAGVDERLRVALRALIDDRPA